MQQNPNQYNQPQLPQQPNQMQQNKCKVFIDNLDQGIQEDYLYKKFKEECGQIVALKINKDRQSQRSKGTAVITFACPDFAEEARKKFNGNVLIKNVIRVKTYLNIYDQDKQANIHISDLDEKVTNQKLEETFSEFGNVQSVDIKLDDSGKSLGYGYIQFEKQDDVAKLLVSDLKTPIYIDGKKLTIQKFKTQSERQVETVQIFLRAFASPYDVPEKFIKAYEYGWQLVIQSYFKSKNIDIKSCFASYDVKSHQPWAMVIFTKANEAQDAYNECEKLRMHQCLQSTAKKAFQLIQEAGPPKKDGTPEFEIKDVQSFFEELQKGNDLYKGDSSKFFFNFMRNKHQNVDKRLLLIRNIKPEITPEELTKFFEKFGRLVRISLIQNKNPKFKAQQSYLHYQTEGDAINALSEVYEKKMKEEVSQIFAESNPNVTILVPKTIRKEMRMLKQTQNESNKNPQNQHKILPQYQGHNNMMQQGGPFPPRQRGPPFNNQAQQQQYPRPPFQGQNRQTPRQFGMPTFNRGIQNINSFQQQGQRQVMGGNNNLQGQMRPQQNLPYQRLQGMQNNMGGQMNQGGQQMQQPQQPQFRVIEDVTQNMPKFTEQHLSLQRQQLGTMLHPLVEKQLQTLGHNNPNWAQRVTGMLIDDKLFEIQEILQLFEGQEELNERIQEGIDLMREEEKEIGQN